MAALQIDPAVRDYLAALKQTHANLSAIYLYGSRARGDAEPRSDYDLALDMPLATNQERAVMRQTLTEGMPTLCKVDVVILNELTDLHFIERIRAEGVVVA